MKKKAIIMTTVLALCLSGGLVLSAISNDNDIQTKPVSDNAVVYVAGDNVPTDEEDNCDLYSADEENADDLNSTEEEDSSADHITDINLIYDMLSEFIETNHIAVSVSDPSNPYINIDERYATHVVISFDYRNFLDSDGNDDSNMDATRKQIESFVQENNIDPDIVRFAYLE